MPDVTAKSPQELIEALIDMGLTQTEISEITKVSQPTIARIKKGDHKDPRSSTVDALRALYDEKIDAGEPVSLDDVFPPADRPHAGGEVA